MTVLTPSARAVIESDNLAHLVTLNPDGSPQVTVAWVGLDGEELVIASLRHFRKLRNIARDPRVSVSMLGLAPAPDRVARVPGRVRDRADRGGRRGRLLRRLARSYIGPDTTFPPDESPPPGWITRITPERLGGAGPWTRGECSRA